MAWTGFVVYISNGFTRGQVERLNDSIRSYVWAIPVNQTQTRTIILKTGQAVDAQRQLWSYGEDAFNSPGGDAIYRYEDVLFKAL